jgi:hypothetical protein
MLKPRLATVGENFFFKKTKKKTARDRGPFFLFCGRNGFYLINNTSPSII